MLFMFATCFVKAQDITILQVNAEWNKHNDMQIKGVRGAKIQYAVLEEQSTNFRKGIKSVPAILIYKDQSLVWKKEAGLTLKLNITISELDSLVRVYKNEQF
jgi:hypothetical protein